MILPLKITHRVKSLEFDVIEDMVYWIDEYGDQRSIHCSLANGSMSGIVVHGSDKDLLTSPIDMALDPYSRHLYWTDDVARNIKITSLTTRATGIIVDGRRSAPRSITLDPKRG